MTKERFDIHQHITDKIVSAIEAARATSGCPGIAPRRHLPPVNIASKKAYRGVNVVALWASPRNSVTAPAPGALTTMVRGLRSGSQGRESRLRRLLQGA